MKKIAIALLLGCVAVHAGMPQLKRLRASWDPYVVMPGGSNAVIVVYKATSLGTVYSPFKRTAIVPASRTNVTIAVLPGSYHFYCTAIVQPFGESDPSNTVTNKVNP